MSVWTSARMAERIRGRLVGNPELSGQGCAIDSRQVSGGEIFFALPGERADGYDYVEKAWEQGGSVAVASIRSFWERPLEVPETKALILVEEPLIALQELAAWRRSLLSAKVIGLTGSSGKTTTKDMLAAVLAQRYRTYKNQGNQNNELGLPLTILNAPENTEVLVLEMGMRGLNEIKALCLIARPEMGVVTNIGVTHMDRLGSREAIARAKWELIDALPPQGLAILNAEDEWSVRLAQGDGRPQRFYGLRGRWRSPDIQGGAVRMTADSLGTAFTVSAQEETAAVRIPLPGEHHVLDALAALAAGLACGIPLAEGAEALSHFQASGMRWEVRQGIHGSTLISDVYNANPESMSASVRMLAERAQGCYTLALLGDMYELGTESGRGHRQVGRTVAETGVDYLMTAGRLAAEIAAGAVEAGMEAARVGSFAAKEEMLAAARRVLRKNADAWVLIKGSRGMKMEEVTAGLRIPQEQGRTGE